MRWKHEQHYASALVVLQYLNGMKEKIIDAQNAKGIYTVIRFANPSDEEYLDRVSMRFSE